MNPIQLLLSRRQIELTRISSDINGNPRRVVHFLQLNTPSELDNRDLSLEAKYHAAVKRANRIGGRRYHNKQYGGGIVFQSYSDSELLNDIQAIVYADEIKQRKQRGEPYAWGPVDKDHVQEVPA